MTRYDVYDRSGLDKNVKRQLGAVRVSEGIARRLRSRMGLCPDTMSDLLARHANGDRGLLPDDDEQAALGIQDLETDQSLFEITDMVEVETCFESGVTTVSLMSEA